MDEYKITECDNIEIDYITIRKMQFIYNAIEEGWNIKKSNDKYIFTKRHEGKTEVFLDSYLRQFLQKNSETIKKF
jgi:hypothetical protein